MSCLILPVLILWLSQCCAQPEVPCPPNPLHSSYCSPVYMIIGAQKAATSDLNSMLMLHPRIRRSGSGELSEYHYFDQLGWSHTRNWHLTPRSNFSITAYWNDLKRLVKPEQQLIVGDKAPCYLYIPYVPRVIQQHAPWMKFIVSLRNPVDRTYSSFLQSLNKYSADYCKLLKANGLLKPEYKAALLQKRRESLIITKVFSAVVALELARIEQLIQRGDDRSWEHLFNSVMEDGVSARAHPVLRSMYTPQLKNWFSYFPREQFKILIFEDFIADVPATVDEIIDFLELPSHFRFSHYFRGGAHSDELAATKNKAVQSRTAPLMLRSSRQQLLQFFLPHNIELQQVIGLDLSLWNH